MKYLCNMKCPKCGSLKNVKNGFVRNKQRYRCARCSTNYTIRYVKKVPDHFERISAILSISGYSNRDIAECIGVSHTTVNNWLHEKAVLKMIQEQQEPHRKLFISKKEALSDTQHEVTFHNWFQIRWNARGSQVIIVKRRRPWQTKDKAKVSPKSELSVLQHQMKVVLLQSRGEKKNISRALISAIENLNKMLKEYLKYSE